MPDGSEKYQVFPTGLQDAITDFTSKGGNLIISGAYIGTDLWSKLYPTRANKEYNKASRSFAQKVLGYKFSGNYGNLTEGIQMLPGGPLGWNSGNGNYYIYNTPNRNFYCVETPDAIIPATKSGRIIARYSDSGAPAGVAHQGTGYRSVCYGFPLETLKDKNDLKVILDATLRYLSR